MPVEGVPTTYPFRYNYDDDEEDDWDDDETVSHPPRLGTKIDELFDSFFEDTVFRVLCPRPLPLSPLSQCLTDRCMQRVASARHSIPFCLFASNARFPRSATRPSLLEWTRLLHEEALIDAGLSAPVDFVTSADASHRQNRHAVYEVRHPIRELAAVRTTVIRALWRHICRFSIHFIKGLFAGVGMYATDQFLFPRWSVPQLKL